MAEQKANILVFVICVPGISSSVFAFYSGCISTGIERFYSFSYTGQNIKNSVDMCTCKNFIYRIKCSEQEQEERGCVSLFLY